MNRFNLIKISKFLMKNSCESHAMMIRLFDINVKTLTSFIRDQNKKHEEHNIILKKHEEEVIDDFIRSLLTYSIPPTGEMIYNAIVSLKKVHDCNASSKR